MPSDGAEYRSGLLDLKARVCFMEPDFCRSEHTRDSCVALGGVFKRLQHGLGSGLGRPLSSFQPGLCRPVDCSSAPSAYWGGLTQPPAWGWCPEGHRGRGGLALPVLPAPISSPEKMTSQPSPASHTASLPSKFPFTGRYLDSL